MVELNDYPYTLWKCPHKTIMAKMKNLLTYIFLRL